VTPGVSFFASDPARAGRSILPLLELASRIVPIAHQPDALVFLRATGGMRLVPEPHRSQLYDELFAAVAAHPSQLKATREAFGTLSGELEGVYAFLSVNHLLARMGQVRGYRWGGGRHGTGEAEVDAGRPGIELWGPERMQGQE
jgi:Golgi nucleoside diphosphatase